MTTYRILWIACIALTLSNRALAGGSTPGPTNNPPPPPDPGLTTPYYVADYWAECTGRGSWTHLGDLTIATPVDAERYRCIRYVIGNLNLDTGNTASRLIAPWLETVWGNVVLEGRPALPRAKLPRLRTVFGNITVDTWNGNTRFELGWLTQHQGGKLRVDSGTTSDLGGFDALKSLHRLELYNRKVFAPQNPQFPRFKGLRGLTSVGSMQVKLAEHAMEDWDFLHALTQVNGKLEIDVDDQIVGTHSIQLVGGQLSVDYSDMYDLSQLDAVTQMGSFHLYGNHSLGNVSALSNAKVASGGAVYIVSNSPLTNCQANTLANEIKSSTSSVTVSTNSWCSTPLIYTGGFKFPRF